MPDQIFISYRRDDAAYVTGHINDRLRKEFGDQSVFTDVDNLALGVDFRKVLDQMVSQCQIVLAVIGGDWLNVRNPDGQLRLQDPKDFVRIEIESALQRNIPVIPLLVAGTKMPAEEDLPESLRELAFRNGTQIRPAPDFHTDMDRLIKNLKKHLEAIENNTESAQTIHSSSTETQRSAKDQERPRSAAKLHTKQDRNRGEFSAIKVQVDDEEKTRKQTEIGSGRYAKKSPWAAPLWVVGLLLVAGASWYLVTRYQEQVQATNATLAAIQKASADAEARRKADAKRQAEADAERLADAKRLADAEAAAKLQLEADAEARLRVEYEKEAQIQAKAETEAQLQAEAETEAKREAEAQRQAAASEETRRQADANSATQHRIRASAAMREGVSLAGFGDYQGAIRNYDEAIRLAAESAFVYKQRGAAYHALGDYEAAVRDYDEAIRLNPDDANAYYNRSASHHALQEFEAAIKDCDDTIRLNPEFINAYYNRAASNKALGNLEAAERDLAAAAALKSKRNESR